MKARQARPTLCVALVALLVSGCGASVLQGGRGAVACAALCQLGTGARAVSVFVEPDAGASPDLSALATATTSVDVEVYQLSDVRVIHGLEDAANRGVRVRVIL